MSEAQHPPHEMLVMVAGQDRTHDLGGEIATAADAIDLPAFRKRMSDESPILELGKAPNEPAFLDRQLAIFGARTQLSFSGFALPDCGGKMGRVVNAIRGVLWRLMRHPHDWTLFHQNAVNEQLIRTLEHEVRLRRREAAALRARLSALEARMTEAESTPS